MRRGGPPPNPGAGLIRDLVGVVGPDAVSTDPAVLAPRVLDWTGRFRGEAAALVRPRSTDEVARVVGACGGHGVAVVPQGGNTGLVAGAVPAAGQVVLGTDRLDQVTDADARAGQLTAGAGVTIGGLQQAAAGLGWRYGVDFSSRDTATVGGSVATNAGGLRVMRHGDTRRQLRGIEAVLADGSVLSHLAGLEKDNTGYDLAGLLCGSEGTLAVVTAARLALVPVEGEPEVALVGFSSVVEAVDAAAVLRRSGMAVAALELMTRAGLELTDTEMGLERVLAEPPPAALLIEVATAAGSTGSSEALAEAVGALAGVVDAAVATDAAMRRRLWAHRERHTEAIAHLGQPHKLDVTLPVSRLAPFVDEVPAVVAGVEPAARTWLFGHVGDGNVHVNITGIEPDDERVDDAVLAMVADAGGSISAEHGIGRAKRRWLDLVRSPAELAVMTAVKRALDPEGRLNPGCLLSAGPGAP